MLTLLQQTDKVKANTTGFDYLRIFLSVSVLIWHSIWYSGSFALNSAISSSKLRFIGTEILPLFFALSGYLVTGSLLRTKLYQFVTLRAIRLLPALAVEVALSALILGPIFSTLSLSGYFTNPSFYTYFLNCIGYIHYTLPGTFDLNPGGPYINAQLWTIPFELECYISLAALSFARVFRTKILYYVLIVGSCLALTVWPIDSNPQGRQLVFCFLVATLFYKHRDMIVYSNLLGWTSFFLTPILLLTPGCEFIVPFPAAYMVVWIGLKSFPKVPFGDLSYGVFLFHLPIEQTIVYLFPSVRSWWLLSAIALPLTCIFAWLSWTLIEYPILKRKQQVLSRVDRLWLFFRLNYAQSIGFHLSKGFFGLDLTAVRARLRKRSV